MRAVAQALPVDPADGASGEDTTTLTQAVR
jgi:hypothetical protein